MSQTNIRSRNLDKAYHRTFNALKKQGRIKDCVNVVFRMAEFYASITMKTSIKRLDIQSRIYRGD